MKAITSNFYKLEKFSQLVFLKTLPCASLVGFWPTDHRRSQPPGRSLALSTGKRHLALPSTADFTSVTSQQLSVDVGWVHWHGPRRFWLTNVRDIRFRLSLVATTHLHSETLTWTLIWPFQNKVVWARSWPWGGDHCLVYLSAMMECALHGDFSVKTMDFTLDPTNPAHCAVHLFSYPVCFSWTSGLCLQLVSEHRRLKENTRI